MVKGDQDGTGQSKAAGRGRGGTLWSQGQGPLLCSSSCSNYFLKPTLSFCCCE